MNMLGAVRATAALGTAAAMAAGGFLAIGPASPASAAEFWNEYTSTLPPFITGSTPFEVVVDGPDAVCSMTFDGTTVSAAPWAFTMPPTADRYGAVDITLCDGQTDYARVSAQPAFAFRHRIQSAEKGGGRSPLTVTNNMDVPATVTVTDRQGKQVATGSADPGADATIEIPTKGLKATTTYNVTATGANGLQMTDTVVVAKGWAPMTEIGAIFPNCSTVTWSYSAKGQPRGARTMKAEVGKSLAYLSKFTGLKFAFSPDADKARLTYAWKDMGKHGPSGVGGPSWSSNGDNSGHVDFNTRDWWVTDRFAGLGAWQGRGTGPGGRGWLVVHETMHALGYDHVSDSKSIMNPTNAGQHAFTKGDVQGLNALYPAGQCR
jgi:hypothetical protein